MASVTHCCKHTAVPGSCKQDVCGFAVGSALKTAWARGSGFCTDTGFAAEMCTYVWGWSLAISMPGAYQGLGRFRGGCAVERGPASRQAKESTQAMVGSSHQPLYCSPLRIDTFTTLFPVASDRESFVLARCMDIHVLHGCISALSKANVILFRLWKPVSPWIRGFHKPLPKSFPTSLGRGVNPFPAGLTWTGLPFSDLRI